jgi:SAM-dependent methyltransferase
VTPVESPHPHYVKLDDLTPFCPLCGQPVGLQLGVNEAVAGLRQWLWCECGMLWQSPGQKPVTPAGWDQVLKDWRDNTYYPERVEYRARSYAPLLEDLTYGRTMLDVGYGDPQVMDYLRARGWVTTGLDVCPEAKPGKHAAFLGDFLSHEFQAPLKTFDLVWMSHVLGHIQNPIKAVNRAYDLLNGQGLLFVAAPETAFIHRVGMRRWQHFKSERYWAHYSSESFAALAEKAGFKTIMARKADTRRTTAWLEFHYIGQKVNP